jgi:hypothetical protein
MRREGILKHFAAAFIIAVIFYLISFSWLQHRREFKGPWRITFRTDSSGPPGISISQTNLAILQSISFPRAHATPNISTNITFDQAQTNLPFGELLFQDPTFLPGTVTMRIFGHQIEMLPRMLNIDHKEYPWRSNEIIVP